MTMNLMRYTPQFGLKPFFTDFDRVLDHFFNDAGEPPAAARRTWAPAVDIVEEDKQFVLTADLPDVNRKDIDLRVDDGTMRRTATSHTNEARRARCHDVAPGCDSSASPIATGTSTPM